MITKSQMDNTQKGIVHRILNFSIKKSCNPGIHLAGTSPDELLVEYFHCMSELLSKIYCTSDMPNILVGRLKHYAVVYGLYSRKLKECVMGHQRTQWKMMEECFGDICHIGARYE